MPTKRAVLLTFPLRSLSLIGGRGGRERGGPAKCDNSKILKESVSAKAPGDWNLHLMDSCVSCFMIKVLS